MFSFFKHMYVYTFTMYKYTYAVTNINALRRSDEVTTQLGVEIFKPLFVHIVACKVMVFQCYKKVLNPNTIFANVSRIQQSIIYQNV